MALTKFHNTFLQSKSDENRMRREYRSVIQEPVELTLLRGSQHCSGTSLSQKHI